MSLSINEAKLAELLESRTGGGYAVHALDLPIALENHQPEPVTGEVSGIVSSYGGNTIQPKEETSFGTHVREAVGIVKDWTSRK